MLYYDPVYISVLQPWGRYPVWGRREFWGVAWNFLVIDWKILTHYYSFFKNMIKNTTVCALMKQTKTNFWNFRNLYFSSRELDFHFFFSHIGVPSWFLLTMLVTDGRYALGIQVSYVNNAPNTVLYEHCMNHNRRFLQTASVSKTGCWTGMLSGNKSASMIYPFIQIVFLLLLNGHKPEEIEFLWWVVPLCQLWNFLSSWVCLPWWGSFFRIMKYDLFCLPVLL